MHSLRRHLELIVIRDWVSTLGHYLPWRVWRRVRAQWYCPHHDATGAGSWLGGGTSGFEGPPGYQWCRVCLRQWWHFTNHHNPE